MPEVSEATTRMLEALKDPDRMFTQDQVLHFIALAIGTDDAAASWRAGYEAGYWARVEEENRTYPPTPYQLGGAAWAERQAYRKNKHVDDPRPEEGDFPGYGEDYVRRLREEWSDDPGKDRD